MTMKVLNDVDNVGIAHGISCWFQPNFAGKFFELGDLVATGITLSPEFFEFYSVRNGLRSLAKKILTKKAASVNLTLNEPNILNLQKVIFGGTITDPTNTPSDPTVYDGRLMKVSIGNGSPPHANVFFASIGETGAAPGDAPNYAGIVIDSVYKIDDANFRNPLNVTPSHNVDDEFDLGVAGAVTGGLVQDEQVYVAYHFDLANTYSTEIFGAANANVQGAAQLQVRNQSGGIVQLWKLASAQLSPNGEIAFPIDAIQTIPLTLTLFERSGTFGTVFAV